MPTDSVGYQDYTEYTQEHEYSSVPGVVQCPIASRTSGHRLIRLHGGYGTRTVKWKAQRSGRPPILPTAASTTGDTLLGSTITPMLPRPNQSASGYDWCVSGEYVYAQNTLRAPGTDALPCGSHPFPVQPADAVGAVLAKAANGISETSNPTGYFTAIGDAVLDFQTGNYIWPYTALPPNFFSGALI